MIDNYPTRKFDKETIIPRLDPWIYDKSGLPSGVGVSYSNSGYAVLKRFFSQAEFKAMHKLADENYVNPNYYPSFEPESGKVRSILGFHDISEIARISASSKMVGIRNAILGDEGYIHQSRVNYKRGMESNGWKWHSDFETWHYQDGMPVMRCFSAMIPLEENTLVNGPLMVLSGSHKEFVCCPKPSSNSSAEENFADQKEGIPSGDAIKYFLDQGGKIDVLTCSPGDLVIFDCNVLHVSNPNVTPYGRMNMFFVFNSLSNKLVAPYSGLAPRPIEMGAR